MAVSLFLIVEHLRRENAAKLPLILHNTHGGIPFLISETFFLSDPELQDEIPFSYLSHKELYEASVRKATIIFKKIRQQQVKDGAENDL